jgi:glycosyltransferase involved in cell wall biosynthesis
MRIALLYDPFLLSARGSLDLTGYRDDARGMTGSEQCAVRLYEELTAMGHEVMLFTNGKAVTQWEYRGDWEFDVALSVNCPDPLKGMNARLKVCYALLNAWTFCKAGFEQHVDLFASPSAGHLEQVLNNPAWRFTDSGAGRYEPDPAKWCIVPLGCDPERYEGFSKVPGRVVYCSSPDRGLHWLLQEWPAIKRAVPHAHLRIFYRLQKWIDDLKAAQQPDGSVFHSVQALFDRAVYIEEALRRMSDPKWGITVCDSVSRATIEREMAEAEVLAYPCDTTTWSEGFSCTTLEGCAARACPVIFDCDALGDIYGDAAAVVACGDINDWRKTVVSALTIKVFREQMNARAEAFGKAHSWKQTATKLMQQITARLAST